MIGACLSPKDLNEEFEPIIVAQTAKGNWLAVDENQGVYKVLTIWTLLLITSIELETDYTIADVFTDDMPELEESKNMAIIMVEQDGHNWEDYLANN